MLRTSFKWGVRLAVVAALATVVARLIESTSRHSGPEGHPVVAGDTWPPVPTNPTRLN